MGDEFHVDGQTDMTNLSVTFRDFANAPSNRHIHYDFNFALVGTCKMGRPAV